MNKSAELGDSACCPLSRPKIAFLNRCYWPDSEATGQLLEELAGHLSNDYDVTVVAPGETVTVGPFTLAFYGGRHNVIHESIPVIDNVGVLVNGSFYYPGDSYAVPADADVQLLAAPVGAPWLKIGEAMDFVLAVAPRRAFGTHDMTLSPIGLGMGRQRLDWAVQQDGGSFVTLDPGDYTEVEGSR